MSADLEDDMGEVDVREELFGDSDEEEQAPATAPAARKKTGRLRQTGAPPAVAKETAEDRRKALQQLALSKKREAETEPDGKARKKQKQGKEGRGKEGSTKASRRARQDAHDELFGEEDEEEEQQQQQHVPVPDRDLPLVANDADNAFIDDEGVAPDDRYGSDGEDIDLMHVEEAEEVAPGQEEDDEAEEGGIEAVMKARKRGRRKESELDMQTAVDDLITLMEVAADEDKECYAAKRPAMHKLKHLKTVQEALLQRKYHELFIQSGGLKAANKWLEPYPDGNLPNARVRQTMVKLLEEIRLDTSMEFERDMLMKSGLGKVVMFMYMNPDEAASTRRVAKELVERWMRPITHDQERERTKKEAKEQMLQVARNDTRRLAQAKDAEREREIAATAALKPGEAGYRLHARMPPQAKLDFVVNPKTSSALMDSSSPANAVRHAPRSANHAALDKRAREVERRRKSAFAGAAKVSVEGRGLGQYI